MPEVSSQARFEPPLYPSNAVFLPFLRNTSAVCFSNLSTAGSLDLLHNSRFELEVVNASDQVEAQAEAFAAISIALRNNFKAFESTDDVFV